MEENIQEEKKLSKKELRNKKLLEYGPDHDIKYRGIVGIRGIRIAAWTMMVFAALAECFTIISGSAFVTDVQSKAFSWVSVPLAIFGTMAIPCFMLAKFSMVFQKKRNFLEGIINYGIMALGVAVFFLLIYYHYGIKTLMLLMDYSYKEAEGHMRDYLSLLTQKKVAFNVFIDMFLWSTYVFILNIEFKNKKVWKSTLKFLLSLTPFLYVFVCYIIKMLFAFGQIQISVAFLPFLPTTSPFIFLAFIFITRTMRKQKLRYMKAGGTKEQYTDYLQTNANSLYFSKTVMKTFIIAGIVDLVVFVICAVALDEKTDILAFSNITGIGDCIVYLLFAPFILLFSITRVYKNDKLDMLVPVIAMIAIVLIALEGTLYFVIQWAAFLKFLLS